MKWLKALLRIPEIIRIGRYFAAHTGELLQLTEAATKHLRQIEGLGRRPADCPSVTPTNSSLALTC